MAPFPRRLGWVLTIALLTSAALAPQQRSENGRPLPGTQPLTWEGDLAARMVSGADAFLMRELEASVRRRPAHWNRDFSSLEAYVESVAPNRERFSKVIGALDRRRPVSMELVATTSTPALVGRGDGYDILAVRWNTLRGVEGEGLLLEPRGDVLADVVALPDCDDTPEALVGLTPGVAVEDQFARRLVENGCRVLIPALLNRRDTYSGNPSVGMTNQPHREVIYRGAFEMGRHIIGYEVQKVLAAVDWFSDETGGERPVGVMGYGEGGLIALYAGGVDPRIGAVAVSGYFQPREQVWREPIYRNVWGLLSEFGDAEIASLIAPRPLTIEASHHPRVEGPPPASRDRRGAAPGRLQTPDVRDVQGEVRRAQALVTGLQPPSEIRLVESAGAGSDETLTVFLKDLGVDRSLASPGPAPQHLRKSFDPGARTRRQFNQMLEHTQFLMREGEFRRAEFWSKADDSSLENWQQSVRWYRTYFWDEVIGRFPPASLPPSPRSRLIYDEPNYRGYEVVLDVYPDLFAYGILLVPKQIAPGERRPVVVCQHGLEGRPQDVADPGNDHRFYHRYANRLADRGFVTFSPQNLYIGRDNFRVLQRKANPLKKSLFSIIVRQHEQIVKWLSTQPFVDPERIAFYGLSYGGKTAMRVPALLEEYSLSICSADYNEWIWKNVSARHRYGYLFKGEYEMPEFDLGNTFNYAEMSWLILPRPFMVERGHHDGVAPDRWVAYEYARTRRRYNLFGIGERTTIEYFNGPHTIHGVGTFEFLHEHLNWPKPDL